MTLVLAWAQSATSIIVESTWLDIDPTCPTRLESFQDDDCEFITTNTTETVSTRIAILMEQIPVGEISLEMWLLLLHLVERLGSSVCC